MSGVEAAASLFGSEDPASDPFTMLGTSDSEHTADNLFSGVQEYSPMTSTTVFDVPSQDSPSNEDIYSNHRDSTELRRGPDLYGYSPNIHQGRDSAGSLGHDAGADYNGAPAHPQLSSLTTTSYSNTYTTQTYQPPVTNVTARETVSTTSGYTVNYTSQTHNPTSTYTPYHPAHTGYTLAHSLNNTPQSKSNIKSAGSAVHGAVVPPSRSAPAASTLNRPKLLNAYDPPFLPSKPSKRSMRPTEAHHTVYQTPSPSGTYMNTTVSTPTPSGHHHTGHPPVHEQYGQVSPEVPFGIHSAATPLRPNTTSHAKFNAGTTPPYHAQSGPCVPVKDTSSVQGNDLQHTGPAMPPPPKRGIESYPPERCSPPPGVAHPARSHTPRRPSVGSNSSQTNSEQSANVSPSSVPLPYSPSEPKFDCVSDTPSYQESVKPLPRHDAYSPPQVHKKAPAPGDPYVPATTRNINYIPRTASPLHKEYIPSAPGKVPTALNLNGTLYNALPRAGPAMPAASYSLDSMSNATTGCVSTPHALGLPQEFGTGSSLGQYAPSPSLLGANDPLSRTSTRAPVVGFGFGGKLVTCFHGMPGLNAGFDIALSARTSSELKVRVLQRILPESALNSPGPSFPGPLVSDPGMPSLSLVISGASSQSKTKKAGLVAYLSSRAEELNQGLGYLSPAQRQQAEHKVILVKLLRIMVENDGRLFGIPQSEAAVRAALVPRLEAEPTLQDGVSLQAAAYHPGVLDEAPISVTSLHPAELSKIEEFLLQGDRRQAYRYALDQKLWAHAMIIASSIDKETWKEAVNDFLHQELSGSDGQRRNASLAASHSAKRSWESLRMAYSFFSGQGSAAVQELAPPTSLQRLSAVSQAVGPPIAAATTPRTPNFIAMQPLLNIAPENLVKWAEAVVMMISSPFTPSSETSSALVALGDQLLAQNWIEAAHACYLLSAYNLSSQPPFINGIGAPGVRITLLGSKNPGSVSKDPDSLFLTEILEFALSLLPSAKGLGIPHLQAYRLVRAVWLAEMGDVQLASRYCEAIAASLSQPSPYSTPVLLEQLNGLQQRLTGVFNAEKSNSWIGGKISKPSLDSIGGWLEGRFTKLVTGDNESTSPNEEHAKVTDQQFVGPFAHYSTISTTPSSRSSPQPTTTLNVTHLPPPHTSSAMATPSPYPSATLEKASSGVTPMRNKQPGMISSPSTSSSPSQSSAGYGINGYGDDVTESSVSETPVAGTASSWWGSDGQSARTPTAATFLPPEHNMAQPNVDGFISLMDSQSFTFESSSRQTSSSGTDNFEDEDLGLGNSKPGQKEVEVEGNEGNPVEENTPATAKPAEKAVEAVPPAASGGGTWFGRWFRRSESSGPVKANLGEESTFFYDKDLKRWVDKKAGGEAAAKTAQSLPPPSRAQTASPGMSASRVPPPPSAVGPPRSASAGVTGPPRPAPAIDLSTEPPTKVPPPRIRSNLAPPAAETVPSPRLSPVGGTPPARPRSQATKRSVRSRYIDVFQQENGGAGTAP